MQSSKNAAALIAYIASFALIVSLTGCGDKPRSRRLASTPPVDSGKPKECEVECKIGAETASCVVLNQQVSRPEYAERAHNVKGLFTAAVPSGKIEKSNLMKLFDHPDDPCNRSSIDVDGDYQFSNFGDACEITYTAASFGEISLVFPSTLKGKYLPTGDGYKLLFPENANSISLKFANQDFNNDYGGTVGNVTVKKQRVLVATPRACIALRI